MVRRLFVRVREREHATIVPGTAQQRDAERISASEEAARNRHLRQPGHRTLLARARLLAVSFQSSFVRVRPRELRRIQQRVEAQEHRIAAIQDLAAVYPFLGGEQLLGCTIAHELGHLLIGAGHRPNGLMRASWSKEELRDLSRRHLKFNSWERAAILHKLQMRDATAAASEVKPE